MFPVQDRQETNTPSIANELNMRSKAAIEMN